MVMKRIFDFLVVLLMTFVIACCDKPQPEQSHDKPEGEFVLEVSDLTSTSCHFSVSPLIEDMTYIVMIVAKAEYDKFEDEYAYQDNDLEWFERKAEEEGKALNEWLDGFLHKGDFADDENGLMPGISYYLYAYGLTVDGYFTSGVTKLEFTTPEVEMTDVTFDLKVSEIGLTEAKVEVTASAEDALFFVNVFTVQQYEEWGGGEIAFANHALALVDYYVKLGQTVDAMVLNLGHVGKMDAIFDGLTADTEYVAYAVGIDDRFFVNTKAETFTFKTKKVIESSNTFAVDIQETTFCSVIGTVTPSNDDPFVCLIQAKSQFENYESDSDIMYELVSTYQKWDSLDEVLYSGEIVDLEEISFLSPETEYYLFCFGWDEAPTTPLTKVEFKTMAGGGNPRGQELTFLLSDIIHNKATVTISPKLGIHYFYDCMPVSKLEEYTASEGSEDEAICRFLDESIDYGAEYFECTRAEYLEEVGAAIGKQKWTFTGLEEDTEYIIVAATVNLALGNINPRTPFRSEAFRTTVLIESNASIEFRIDKYYDGTELAALDPSQFSKCKGMVMVPYTIVPDDEAAHWRTTFTYGEFASWAERDDILFELDYQSDYDKTQGFAVVHYDQIVSFMGIAEDVNGYTGPFTLYEFMAVKGGASPAREFIDSLK